MSRKEDIVFCVFCVVLVLSLIGLPLIFADGFTCTRGHFETRHEDGGVALTPIPVGVPIGSGLYIQNIPQKDYEVYVCDEGYITPSYWKEWTR